MNLNKLKHKYANNYLVLTVLILMNIKLLGRLLMWQLPKRDKLPQIEESHCRLLYQSISSESSPEEKCGGEQAT